MLCLALDHALYPLQLLRRQLWRGENLYRGPNRRQRITLLQLRGILTGVPTEAAQASRHNQRTRPAAMPAETPGPDAYRVLLLAPTRRDREATQELLARANIQTGIPGLDAVLYGGLIPRRLYLVDGNPGAGKRP
jgi:hypothetical protein